MNIEINDRALEARLQKQIQATGAKPAIWAVAHRLLRVIWKVLHDKVSYVEPGLLDSQALERRRKRYVRHLRKLGFAVTLTPIAAEPAG